MSIESVINNYPTQGCEPNPNPIYVLLGVDWILRFESDMELARFFWEELPTRDLISPYIYVFREIGAGEIERYVFHAYLEDDDSNFEYPE